MEVWQWLTEEKQKFDDAKKWADESVRVAMKKLEQAEERAKQYE